MRRLVYILILVVSFTLAACDSFGSNKKGGDEGEGKGGDDSLVLSES